MDCVPQYFVAHSEIFMYDEISHSAHFIPGYFRVFGTDLIRHMGGSFTNNDKVSDNRIDCLSVVCEVLEAHFPCINTNGFQGFENIVNSDFPISMRHEWPPAE